MTLASAPVRPWRRLAVVAALVFTSIRPSLACPPLPVAPDEVEPIERLFGATNVNAALGDGGLTAGFSRCGELTVLKWPGPSYHDQLDYLSSNAEDARRDPLLGALPSAGAFAGISYRRHGPHWSHTWLRDDGWTHAQRYTRDDAAVLEDVARNEALGLVVTARAFVLPGRDVLVQDYVVERRPGSPVREARLVHYANLAPTLARLPLFPVADWALDFQNDYAVLWDGDARALLGYVPASAAGFPHDFSRLAPLLTTTMPRRRLRRAVQRLVRTLDAPGVYVALAPRTRRFRYQAGFDDAPACAHQSALAEQTLALQGLPDAVRQAARALFVCDVNVPNPDGLLAECRQANGWTYQAESALADAADGRLSGSPIAACRTNTAVSERLRFRRGTARSTFYLAVAGTHADAVELLARARADDPDAQRAETEGWWRDFMAPVALPDTDDPRILAVARRAIVSLRTAADRASGAIVASIATQPPYGEDWPRDGAFVNQALDRAGHPELVAAHDRFYARVQRTVPAAWSPLYAFGPCDPEAAAYPACVPAGTFEMNYYADPDAAVPGGFYSFEIDEAGLGVWALADHARFAGDAGARAAYLADVCPAIVRGATNLAACRDPLTGLQCFANEDDSIDLTQTLQGASAVYLALRSAVTVAADCGVDAVTTSAWADRAAELQAAALATFSVADPLPHLEGPRPPWALWPSALIAPDHPLAISHAAWLGDRLQTLYDRSKVRTGYDVESVLVRAMHARAANDGLVLAGLQDEVRFFVHHLTTPDTLHMGEFAVRVQADLDGDGIAPDYLQANAVPHVWEQSDLYLAALEAFGERPAPAAARR
jgi:hypothetical protein